MKHLLFFSLLIWSSSCFGQYALYNTGTLFDSFENPAQKAFKADTSRKYAFNFFIPHFTAGFGVEGPADPAIKNLLINGSLKGIDLEIGYNHKTDVAVNVNNYLLSFKVFQSIRKQREVGFSWQVRSDSQVKLTNEVLGVFENFSKFQSQSYYENFFNSKLKSTSYHQLSFSYRQNLDERTGIGIKASYLSGMVNYLFEVDSSKFIKNFADTARNRYNLFLRGSLRSNTPYKEFETADFIPGIRNPGLSVTLSGNHHTQSGWFFMGNVKDLGFIKWNGDSYKYSFNNSFTDTVGKEVGKRLGKKIDSLIKSQYKQAGYITPVNTKIEAYISKNFYFYTPALILSKNVFYDGAEIALTNNFKWRTLNFNVSTAYSTLRGLQTGVMGMVKGNNGEFYMGSDNLIKTYYTAKGIATDDTEIGNGNSGASFFMGFALKFGRVVEHNSNTTYIPGIGEKTGGGFLRRIFSRKK